MRKTATRATNQQRREHIVGVYLAMGGTDNAFTWISAALQLREKLGVRKSPTLESSVKLIPRNWARAHQADDAPMRVLETEPKGWQVAAEWPWASTRSD